MAESTELTRKGKVQTVLGLVPPTALGHTSMHEHILVDLRPGEATASTADDLARWDQRIRLVNLHEVRMHYTSYRTNMVLDSERGALVELGYYAVAGGGCIVDVTTPGMGRQPAALRRISKRSGIHVVMGAGYYVWQFHPESIARSSEDAVCEAIVRDVTEGINGVFPGIIGEIGLTWPLHAAEYKVLRAAVKAQRLTGLALSIHPGRHPRAPVEVMNVVIEAGGDPSRTIVDHLDRTLFDLPSFLELARTGCYLELDLFGMESCRYAPSLDVDMPNDGARLHWLRQLIDAGYSNRILVAQDICLKHQLRRYGGPGYDHLLTNVVPLMKRRGWTDSEVAAVFVNNPARILAIT